jgi:hypothetical protein
VAGSAGGAGGAAGNGAGGKAGGSGTSDGGTDAVALCGSDTDPSEGLTCGSLVATGNCVTASTNTGAPPAPGGGTIQTGTYDLISITVYPGDSGTVQVLSPVRKTVTVAHGTAGAYDTQEVDVSGSYVRRQNGSITTSAAMLTFTQTCPTTDGGNNANGTAGYTVTTGNMATLTVFEPQGSSATVVEVYQKR